MRPKVVIFENTYELYEFAIDELAKQLHKKPSSTLGLSTGKTMIPFYNHLACRKLDLSKAITFNQDEYLEAPPKQSYHTYMKNKFLAHTNIKPENMHIPPTHPFEAKKVCKEYEKKITKAKVDLQFLGLGRDGHIGFNEPGTSFSSKTHIATLNKSTQEANHTKLKKAITIGISTILKAKKIVLIATGEHKAKAVRAMLNGPISTKCPASALRKHKDVLILLDKKAASLL